MRGLKILRALLGFGAAVQGARDGMIVAGYPVPPALEKAANKAADLGAIMALGEGNPGLDAYDAFLDETARMGASHRVFRVLADGSLDLGTDGQPVFVNVPPLAVMIEDKVLDALRRDPVDGA